MATQFFRDNGLTVIELASTITPDQFGRMLESLKNKKRVVISVGHNNVHVFTHFCVLQQDAMSCCSRPPERFLITNTGGGPKFYSLAENTNQHRLRHLLKEFQGISDNTCIICYDNTPHGARYSCQQCCAQMCTSCFDQLTDDRCPQCRVHTSSGEQIDAIDDMTALLNQYLF